MHRDGVQGDTADHADSLLSDSTDAAAGYVGLTRGRYTSTIHIAAGTLDDAHEQWIAAAGRNRADLGLDQARAAATDEARNYAAVDRQEPRPRTGDRGAAELRRADAAIHGSVGRRLHTPRRGRRRRTGSGRSGEGIDEHQDHDTPTQSGPHL